MKDGVLIINKPAGKTSHDVVQVIRRKLKLRRVGHAGTLDPMATGVLVILLGKCTKLFKQFVNFDKSYQAVMQLGLQTDSADIQGKILKESPFMHVTGEQIERAFALFVGEIVQVPPMVSAVKWKGKRLYELARAGTVIEREPRKIIVKVLKIQDIQLPFIKFYLECSKGTYVRQLAEDIGLKLSCGACITQIQRLAVGPFVLPDAIPLDDVDERYIRNWKY